MDLLDCFDIHSLNDNKYFCKWDLMRINTLRKFELLIPRLQEVYLPCKARIYVRVDTLKDNIQNRIKVTQNRIAFEDNFLKIGSGLGFNIGN